MEFRENMQRNDKLRCTMSIILSFIPILDVYLVGATKVSYGDAALAMLCVMSVYLGLRERRIARKCNFVLYYTIWFFVACVSVIINGWEDLSFFTTYWLRIAVFVIVIDIAAKRNFDYLTLRKCLMYIGFILSCVLILQVTVDRLFHVPLVLFVPFMRINYPTVTTQELIARHMAYSAAGSWRCSAVFLEPAHFCQYMLLCLIATLLGSMDGLDRKKRFLFAAAMTVAIFLSRSANGIFLSIPVWVVYFWKNMRKGVTAKKVVLSIFLLVLLIVFLTKTDYLARAWWRVETATVRSGPTTGNMRLLNGYYIFGKMNLAEKLFGIGYGNIVNFFQNGNVQSVFGSGIASEYMNGLSTLLTSSGIFGLVFYAVIWAQVYFEQKDTMRRVAFIVLSALYFTSALFNANLSAVYIVLIRGQDKRLLEQRSICC